MGMQRGRRDTIRRVLALCQGFGRLSQKRCGMLPAASLRVSLRLRAPPRSGTQGVDSVAPTGINQW